jgi:hypothetical protein
LTQATARRASGRIAERIGDIVSRPPRRRAAEVGQDRGGSFVGGQAPQEVRDAAAALDVTPTFESRAHGELEARVRRAYQFIES